MQVRLPRVLPVSIGSIVLLFALPQNAWGAGSMYINYNGAEVASTYNFGTHKKPCVTGVSIMNGSSSCYVSATDTVPQNTCPDPTYGPCSTGPMYVSFSAANPTYSWLLHFTGDLRVYGGNVLKPVVIQGVGPGDNLLGISGLTGDSTLSISIQGDITGSVSAYQLSYPYISVNNVGSAGSISLDDTGGSITATGSIEGSITTGVFTGTISAQSITGTIQVGDGSSGTISAPTISGTIRVSSGFTGTIAANGLTPSTIPSNWRINEPDRCGFYVKDLSTGGPAEYVDCLSFDVPIAVTVPEASSGPFVVKLDREPSNPISVTVSHYSDDSDIAVTAPAMPFTLDNNNWNTGVTVTLSAAADADADDGEATIKVEAAGVPDAFVTATEDDSNVGFVFDTDTVSVPEGGTAQFNVSLSKEPSSDVQVAIQAQVGVDPDITVQSGGSLTFTTANYATWQTVTPSTRRPSSNKLRRCQNRRTCRPPGRHVEAPHAPGLTGDARVDSVHSRGRVSSAATIPL